MWKKKAKPIKVYIIILYFIAAAGLLYGFHPLVHALGKRTVTLEIGAEHAGVSAVLTQNGVLTISGIGRTRNYTAETAPFQEYADRITAVEIEEGITGIGDFLFYNCKNLEGRLELPSSVIWIGDEAFSGESQESAPKFTVVSSAFTEAEIARPKSDAESPETTETATETESTATPGNAEETSASGADGGSQPEETTGDQPSPGETTAGSQGSQLSPGETTAGSQSGQLSPTETTAESQSGQLSPTETTAGSQSGQPTPTETTAGSRSSQQPKKSTSGSQSSHTNSADSIAADQGSAMYTAQGKLFRGLSLSLRQSSQIQPEAAATETTAADESETETSSAVTESEEAPSHESRPSTAESTERPAVASPSTPESEPEDEETEDSEEFDEEGLLFNDLYDGAIWAGELEASERDHYLIETITSQIIGGDIFYPHQKGAYECSNENSAFIEAAQQAGYTMADRYIEVRMEGTVQTYPVVNGYLAAPSLPAELKPEKTDEDPFFTDSFTGWTVERDWETMGYDAPLYGAGSAIPVDEGVSQLSLYANWEKTCSLIPEIHASAEGNMAVYTLVDGNTGETIRETSGYEITCTWQISDTGDSEDDGAWEEIEGVREPVYRREAFIEDESKYFRAMVTLEKQSMFRAAAEPVTLYTDPSAGVYELKTITITYEAGDGASEPETETKLEGDSLLVKSCPFTRTDGSVFTGWKISFQEAGAKLPSGNSVAEGAVISPHSAALTLEAGIAAEAPSVTLTAQWGTATVIYVNAKSGNDSNDGKTPEKAVASLKAAYDRLPLGGSKETNIIELAADTTTVINNTGGSYNSGDTSSMWPDKTDVGRSATIRGNGSSSLLEVSGLNGQVNLAFRGDTVWENFKFNSKTKNILYLTCSQNNFTIEESVTQGDFEGYVDDGTMGPKPGENRTVHVFGTRNGSVDGKGSHGASPDDPVTITINSPDINFARVALGGRSNSVDGSPEKPLYGKIEVNAGKFGVVGSGSINQSGYYDCQINVKNAEVYRLMGANVGNDNTFFNGKSHITVESGNVEYLYNAGFGRMSASNNYSYGEFRTEILGGNIGTVYGGTSVSKMEGNSYLDIRGGTITEDVYGASHGKNDLVTQWASNLATIKGDVETHISGGLIQGNVYAGGGGYKPGNYTGSAVVTGNVSLEITGGEITGSVFGGGKGLTEDTSAAKIIGSSNVRITGGTIQGSVYGGGDLGSLEGSSNLEITGNPSIGGNIYGGGNSSGTIGTTHVLVNTALGSQASPIHIFGAGNGGGTTTQDAAVEIGTSTELYGNVFGGGEAGKASTTSVTLKGGTIHGDVFGGGNAADVAGTVTLNSVTGSSVDGSIYGGSNSKGTIGGEIALSIGGAALNVFGAGKGPDTKAEAGTAITLTDGAVISRNVYGGGEEGLSSKTRVELSGGKVEGNVFGGGNNVGTDTSEVLLLDGAKIAGNIYGGSNDKGTVTRSGVTVKGTDTSSGVTGKESRAGSIFGGGYGINTQVTDSYVTAEENCNISSLLFGGGELGKTIRSHVVLKPGSQVTDVFGGGSQADVTESANITAESTSQAQNIYGGSNSSGTVTNPVVTLKGTAINAYGAGKGSGTITSTPQINAEDGAAVTFLYGGGEQGQTTDGAAVNLKNGSHVTNTFGGGNAAGVAGTSIVTMESGAAADKIYGGSNSSGSVTSTEITISGAVGTAEAAGAVYGAGLGKETSTGNTKVTLESTGVIYGEIFGGGAEGPVTGDTVVLLRASSKTNGNVYAGGDAAVVAGSSELSANDSSVIEGNLFGGGKGSTANIGGDTHVIAFAHVTGNIFGGGAEGAVTGSTHVDIAKGLVDGDGITTGNVFGGSDKAKVTGDTKVHIGWKAVEGTGTDKEGTLVIKGTVFGGGNTTDNGNTFDASDPFVLGNTLVSIDASDYTGNEFNIEKSILGDGNMCTVKGSRTISIKNYEALGTQSNTSIQRADTVTLDHSKVELSGATDSANLVPTVAYSLNRIDDMILKGESTLKIQAPVNLVKHLKSLDSLGSPVSAVETGEAPATKNEIIIQQGTQMELRTTEDVTRPEYGSVTGYSLMSAYDKEGGAIESGVYILGGYNGDEAAGGFLYGDGADQYKKIVPSTDNSTWRNWALGTNMTKRDILVMSDKPAGGKIVQLESPWKADGAVYRLIKNEVQITSILGDGTEFVVKDPAAFSDSDSPSSTLGITISTGAQGWVSPVEAGYITGSSLTGPSGDGFGGLSSEKLQTINNSSITPTIQIELSNRLGITAGDPSEYYPLTVQFKMEKVKELSDGSVSKQGELTVILQIRREASLTYEDILLSTGKEYVRGNQTYSFETMLGTSGATISGQSAVTLQYARKRDDESEGARDHKLSFSSGDTLSAEGTPITIPAGTTILAVDRTDDFPVYAHYTVPSGGATEVLLSQFTKNGTDQAYSRTFSQNEKENYLFVMDFAKASGFQCEKLCVTFQPIYGGTGTTVKPARIVFNVSGDPKTYGLSSPDATGAQAEGKYYERNAVIPLALTTWANVTTGIDTTGKEVEMGVRLRLKNRDAGVSVPIPTDWLVTRETKTYKAEGNDITVPLSASMMETTTSLEIQMQESSLPAGRYQWEIYLVSAAQAEYPGHLTGTPLYLNFNLTDEQYSITANYQDPSASRLYPAESGETRLPMELAVKLKAAGGADTAGVKQKVSLWRKDAEANTYTNIDFNTLFTDMSGTGKLYDWQEDNSFRYSLKQSLPEGTYRLKFELVKTTGGSEQLLTYDMENFIVTP